MTAWQYAQLVVDLAPNEDAGLIIPASNHWQATWYGPDGIKGEPNPIDNVLPLPLLNQVGADGWEIADMSEDRTIYNNGTSKVTAVRYLLKRPMSP